MTPAERQRRRRARLRGEIPPWQPKPKKRPPQFPDEFRARLTPIEALRATPYEVFVRGLRRIDESAPAPPRPARQDVSD
jgi:hypothetical protein